MTNIKTYSEMITYKTFEERVAYLRLNQKLFVETFGHLRWLNQHLYKSREWNDVRQQVIIRDKGCNLAVEGRCIPSGVAIYVHHINPITVEDIERHRSVVFDLENLVTTIKTTHDDIHYGIKEYVYTERTPFDTCPWKGGI